MTDKRTLDDEFETELLTEADAGQTVPPASVADVEVEIEDDTPEQDRGKPPLDPGAPSTADGVSDDDLQGASEAVRKRIQKLKYEFHQERRAREARERVEQQAVEYARQLYEENERLRKTLDEGRGVLVSQAQERIGSQLTQAKEQFARAYEAGDTAALLAAQERMLQLQLEQAQLRNLPPAPKPVTPAPPAALAQTAPQRAAPSQAAAAWAQQNPWFGSDAAMTALAMAVHEQAVREGVAPDTKEYYDRINKEIRTRFPERFSSGAPAQTPSPRRATTPVAPAPRSGAPSPTRVTLTASEAELARKLGITPQQYAAEKLRLRKKDNRND